MIESGKRVPSLDGLRTFAVFTVIGCHLLQRFSSGMAMAPQIDGVEIFFVLSGFLITLLLLKEQGKTGEINLFSFYKRRVLRIVPPFYVYLVFVAVFCAFTAQAMPWRQLGSAALFLSNMDPKGGSPFTDHLWSLALEEQFYLAWPLLLVLLLRSGGRRRAAQAALLLIVLSPVARIIFTVLPMGALSHHQAMLLPARMDSLFSGCLFALLIGNRRFERVYTSLSPYWWTAPLFLIVLSPLLRLVLGNSYTFTIGYTVESLAIAYFMLWATRQPSTLTGRVLNWKPFVSLSLASYSIYLYQGGLIHLNNGITWANSLWRILLIVCVAATLAYYLVEQPIARLRNKLAARRKRSLRPEIAASVENPSNRISVG